MVVEMPTRAPGDSSPPSRRNRAAAPQPAPALDRSARPSAHALSEREQAILDFECSWWTEPGVKETAIRDRFHLSATRYYRILHELIGSAEAMAYDPLLVRRLRRASEQRRRVRVERRAAEGRTDR